MRLGHMHAIHRDDPNPLRADRFQSVGQNPGKLLAVHKENQRGVIRIVQALTDAHAEEGGTRFQ